MSVPVIEEVRPTPLGIVLVLYSAPNPGGANIELTRAPDSGGAPDTGAGAVVAILPSGGRLLMDLVGGGGPYWYRARHVLFEAVGPYTEWVSARPTVIPPELPAIPELVGALSSGVSTTTHTGSTTETTLLTHTISGGRLGNTGVFEMTFVARKSFTNGTVTLRVKFDGDTVLSFTTPAAGDIGDMVGRLVIRANGPSGNTYGVCTLATEAGRSHAAANDALVQDLTQDRNVTITGQLANGSDEIAVDAYITHYSGAFTP